MIKKFFKFMFFMTALSVVAILVIFLLLKNGAFTKKQEIENDTKWVYSGIYEVSVDDKEVDSTTSEVRAVRATTHQDYFVITMDSTGHQAEHIDYITCSGGTVTYYHNAPEGEGGSIINGITLYSSYTETNSEMGTYDGKKVKITAEGYDEKAYASEDVMYVVRLVEWGDKTYEVTLKFELEK